MKIIPGTILLSTSALADTVFEKTVILIIEHNEKGSAGFVVNKLFSRSLHELQEYAQSKPFPLYEGGPVEKEGIFFLHQRPDIIAGGKQVFDDVYLGGNFAEAVDFINSNANADKYLKLCIGYCGWDAGQLQEEITEGSFIPAADSVNIFSSATANLWEKYHQQK